MAKSLVIVESPAKAKTIGKYLGKDYLVKASLGHVKDLPKKDLAVDVERDFTPRYEVIEGKKKLIAELKQAAKGVDFIYLAADPDREGEAICWHLKEELEPKKAGKPAIFRVMFNEITAAAVKKAFERPLAVNVHLVEAQQARRVLDRLVGYKISPLLWDKVRRGLSAGRVQTVAVRVIVEREREIRAFQKQEYWTIDVSLNAKKAPVLTARLNKKADAIVAASDKLSTGCLTALARRNIKVPDDMGIVGFTNSLMTEIFHPPLSSVRQPAFEMGQVAMEMLIQIIESKHPIKKYETRVLNTELTVRASSVKGGTA